MLVALFGNAIPLMAVAATLIAVPADAAAPMRFVCQVEGASILPPTLSADAICGSFKAGVDSALGLKTVAVAQAPDAAADKSGWVRIDVRIAKQGIVSAKVTRADRGHVEMRPETSIAVSDRAIGPDTIESLVREVARELGKK